mgnify:CR=1 FL=1
MTEEIIKIKSEWKIPYTHTAGEFASRFFKEIRDNKKLYAVKCSGCRRVLFPPRPFCEKCFQKIDEWIEVKDEGELIAFTISYMKYTGLPDPPYSICVVKLDGTDTPFVHRLGGVDLSDWKEATKKIKIGAKVKAVWKEKNEREGRITDILFFKP